MILNFEVYLLFFYLCCDSDFFYLKGNLWMYFTW
jgi:hypothetical protein